ncbi:MAG: hypothetical protein JRN35_10590 [Nitrososphaerota archaeon]|nr:hypothetical protein [Nitrososphaerota archaeon]
MNPKTGIIVTAILALVIFVGFALAPAGIPTTQHNGTPQIPAAATTELGKAGFEGDYSFNVSWAAFTAQTTGKVFFAFGSDATISKTTANVSFTTKNYTNVTGLDEIGAWSFLVENGTAFPSSTSTEFTASVPLSAVLEKFKAVYVGNHDFNVSWSKFKDQKNVSVFYHYGKSGNISASNAEAQVLTVNYTVIDTNNATSGQDWSFLVVNTSIYPAGNVNVTKYIQTVTVPSTSGVVVAYNGYGYIFSDSLFWLGVIVVLVVTGIVALRRRW